MAGHSSTNRNATDRPRTKGTAQPGQKGRTSIKNIFDPSPTKPHTQTENRQDVSRSINSGAGTKRGNRRDMHPDPGQNGRPRRTKGAGK